MLPEIKIDSTTPPHEEIRKCHFKICVSVQSSDRKNTVGGKSMYCRGLFLVLHINS